MKFDSHWLGDDEHDEDDNNQRRMMWQSFHWE